MQLIFRFIGVPVAACLAACGEFRPPLSTEAVVSTSGPCGAGSYVRAELYGAIRSTLDWSTNLTCDGMPRPDGQGARLRLSGPAPVGDTQQLALILGMPGLVRGAIADELQTNVTLIAEDQGLFFSTTDAANCWTDIVEHAARDGSRDTYRVSGVLYCVAPLPEVNGSKSITLGDLKFAGTLTWKIPE